MYCKNCGKEIKPDAKFCPYCGKEIQKSVSIEVFNKKIYKKINESSNEASLIILFSMTFLIIVILFMSNHPILAICSMCSAPFVLYKIYEQMYFSSENFYDLKNSIKVNTQKCNDLNSHIQDLKKISLNAYFDDYGNSEYYDESSYNYSRPCLSSLCNSNNIYDCSLSVCRNAKRQPFTYFCKYFNIIKNEKTLEVFEEVFNKFSAVEQGKELLLNERNLILLKIKNKIPSLIYKYSYEKLIYKLGFDDYTFNAFYYPKYTFQYISPGGNSSMICDVVFDVDNLERFIQYLSNSIKLQNSITGQRALMTSKLREEIKERDNYTCQMCGLSTSDEPNLLLEIDHIIPISKNGKTTRDNLQTLCWKCNRTKSNKILENK